MSFETAVANFTHVHELSADTEVARPVHRLGLNQVVGALVVVVESYAEAVVQECCIDTQVELFRSFPSQVRINHIVKVPHSAPDTARFHTGLVEFVPSGFAEHGALVVVTDRTQVTYATPRSTNLEEVNGVGLREEAFVRNLPSGSYGREVAVVVALRQTACVVATERSGSEVAVVE